MATRRASSAQDQWLRRPQLTWRRAFPGFAGMVDLAAEVLGHETRLLAIAAAGLVIATFAASLAAAYLSPSWTSLQYIEPIETWTLVAVALVGGWTSLGSRAWHVRFPIGSLTAAWLIAVHLAGSEAQDLLRGYDAEKFSTRAIGAFCLAAFGAAWIASIGRFFIAGPRAELPGSRLRRGQFGVDTLLWTMLLVAAVLGLWQLTRGMDVGVWFHSRHLVERGSLPHLSLTAGAAVLALAAGFGRWRFILAVCGVWLLALMAADASLVTRLLNLPQGAFWPGAVSLGLALPVVWLLRLSGFRRISSGL